MDKLSADIWLKFRYEGSFYREKKGFSNMPKRINNKVIAGSICYFENNYKLI